MEATSKLKNGSSHGIDKISSDLLKKYNIILCKALCHIFNLRLSENKAPDAIKVALITPTHKKGPISSINNFRLISVTFNS